MGESLVRSWSLVTGKSWRTFFVVLVAGLGALAVLFIGRGLASIFGNTLAAEVLFFSAAFALSVPLATTYFLLLFEDYQSLEREEQRQLPL